MAETVLTREEMMTPDSQKVWVPLPHKGDDIGVYVRMMSAADRDAIEAGMVGQETREQLRNLRARLVVATACDANGEKIFGSLGDADELGKRLDHRTADIIFDASRKLNKVFLRDAEVAELEKN